MRSSRFIIGFILFYGGIALIVAGIFASRSLGDSARNFPGMDFPKETYLHFVGGVAVVFSGLLLLIGRRNQNPTHSLKSDNLALKEKHIENLEMALSINSRCQRFFRQFLNFGYAISEGDLSDWNQCEITILASEPAKCGNSGDVCM